MICVMTPNLKSPTAWLILVGLTISAQGLHAATAIYSFDTLNRLTAAVYSDGSSEAFTYDPAGNRLSRITRAATTNVDITPPSVPAGLVTNDFSPSQVSISWDPAVDTGGSGLAGYEVFLNGTIIATSSVPSFVLTGLVPDTQYCLRVAAFDHSGNVSSQTTNVCVTTPVFQPPLLRSLFYNHGVFWFEVDGGTPGPYDLIESTNLIDWEWNQTVLAPGVLIGAPTVASPSQRFYRLRWSTNAP